MNTETITVELLKTLNDYVKNRKSFSAYDMTKELRNLGLNNVFHKDVKPLVHEFMKTLVDIGNYTVTDNGTYKVYSPLVSCEDDDDVYKINDSGKDFFNLENWLKCMENAGKSVDKVEYIGTEKPIITFEKELPLAKGQQFWDSVVSHSEAVSKAKECKSCDPDCTKQVCKKVEDKKEKNLLDKPAPKLTQAEVDLQLLQQFSQLISDLFYKKV